MFISTASYLSSSAENKSHKTYFISQADVCSINHFGELSAFEQKEDTHIRDRSLNYGDGCFTTIYAQGSQICLFEQHLTRLARDGHKLDITIDTLSIKKVLQCMCLHYIAQFQAENKKSKEDGIAIKILLSRGQGGRGYSPANILGPHIYLTFQKANKVENNIYAQAGLQLEAASLHLSEQPLLAGLKHNNRLEQVLAKQELSLSEADDLLLCNQTGQLIEATAANVFLYIDGVWHTPVLDTCGVAGVMRGAILSFMNEQNIEHKLSHLSYADVFKAKAMFICNALRYIKPVSTFTQGHQRQEFDLHNFPQNLGGFFEWASQYNTELAKLEF